MDGQDILRETARLIEHGWYQHADARDPSGTAVTASDPSAIAWSLTAALAPSPPTLPRPTPPHSATPSGASPPPSPTRHSTPGTTPPTAPKTKPSRCSPTHPPASTNNHSRAPGQRNDPELVRSNICLAASPLSPSRERQHRRHCIGRSGSTAERPLKDDAPPPPDQSGCSESGTRLSVAAVTLSLCARVPPAHVCSLSSGRSANCNLSSPAWSPCERPCEQRLSASAQIAGFSG